ncbi:MAG: Mrp/NBP35 family ATP-binding protein [Desulfarculaceae bacterium]|nr:Mrp/NBP35 family ATP-binding protein [Desulfarculaceae bacterium]MCF8071483.1 Mrp/NBP35 family ATP-binding protein [Desulfarculaceae bacterium]MCF8102298.1 Mrp/NBP35 family ATP-binding protein [Desulfarculaceae bacterium]MCF8114762.1 Mrp/NBP35 family ATP-binding protein [Desulfarculaceae bacterium]
MAPGPGAAPQADPLDERLSQSLAGIKHKILVMSGKGGVGKSTVAAQLALGLASRGKAVGLLDVDLHGPSIPRMLGVPGHARVMEAEQLIDPVVIEDGLKVMSVELLLPNKESSIIWRGPMKIGVIKQLMGDVNWGGLDYLVIDAPPGTGDEPLTVAQEVKDARAVLVTSPQEIALADLRKSLDFCVQVELPILGLVENMAGLTCPHCGGEIDLLGHGGGAATAQRFSLEVLGSLPWDPKMRAAADSGKLISYMAREAGQDTPWGALVESVLAAYGEGN